MRRVIQRVNLKCRNARLTHKTLPHRRAYIILVKLHSQQLQVLCILLQSISQTKSTHSSNSSSQRRRNNNNKMDYTKSNLSILKKTAKNNRNSKSFISILLFLLLLLLWLRLHFKLKNSAEAFLRSTSSNQMARRPIFSSNNSTLFVIAGTYQIP